MKTYELVVPCHFGLESVTKREIHELGYEIIRVMDGRVSFIGDADAIARANVFLRTGERVLLKVGSFRALSWEDLFQKTRRIPWEEYLPMEAKFWVTKASSIKSSLYSPRDIQAVMKKAIVFRMNETYHLDRFPETGASYPLRVFIQKDEVMVYLDTSGDSLHKRGYRLKMGKAPITETLAAALVMLSGWTYEHPLIDPMCGSGTFLIEAAMIAANVAPGMNREFRAEEWANIVPRKYWYQAIEEANDDIRQEMLDSAETDIQGYDIDRDLIRVARENADRAMVGKMIHFQERDVSELSHRGAGGFLLCNPPYGERMGDEEELKKIYSSLKSSYEKLNDWQMHVISGWEDTEKYLGKAMRNRKVYNGMMKTYFYSYNIPLPSAKQKDQNDQKDQKEQKDHTEENGQNMQDKLGGQNVQNELSAQNVRNGQNGHVEQGD